MEMANIKQFWALSSVKRKGQGILLVMLTVFGALLEIVSLAAVFPVIAYILDPLSAVQSKAMQYVQFITNFIPIDEAISIGLLFALVVLVSSCFRVILVWLQVSWGNAIGHDFAVLVFSRLLNQSYEKHLARNTSEIVAAVTIKINQLVGCFINPLVAICSSLVLLIAIAGVLVSVSGPGVLASILLIALIYIFIMFSVRSRLSLNSQVINDRSSSIIQQVQESFQGIREVILSATGQERKDSFAKMDKEFRAAQSSSTVLSQAPRYVVESILMISLVGFALIQAGNLNLSGDLLPSLGVIILGVQKLMPLTQAIYTNVATINSVKYSIEDVAAMASVANFPHEAGDKPFSNQILFEKNISVEQLSYRYPGEEKEQLKQINLCINKGEWVGVYGKTGSGKSTLLDVLCGLLSPTSGWLLVDGVKLGTKNHVNWQNKLAVVSQSIYFSDTTVLESVAPKEQNPDLNRINACLTAAQLLETVESFDLGLQTRIGESGVQLSGGQLQRLSIARALYRDAQVLIFDEATSALDYDTERDLMKALKNLRPNLTVVLVAHRLNTLKTCDSLFEMKDGKIVSRNK